MSGLLQRYSGGGATDYDSIREHTPRWKREQAIFSQMIRCVQPAKVVDCPFGTGRWAGFYSEGAQVIGIDLSEDMLAVAAKKTQSSPARFRLVQGNIIQDDFAEYAGVDLLVCVRFLNWLSPDDAKAALVNFSRMRPRRLIVGASVMPASASVFRKLRMRVAQRLNNLWLFANGQPNTFVHREAEVLRWFRKQEWVVRKREFVFGNRSRENYFYLLENTASATE